jgi:hypothetical protein
MNPELFAPFIPIVAILAFAGVKVARIWADARGRVPDPHGAERLAALEDEVGVLRGQLEEMHERLDFTERLLARQAPDRLDPPRQT